MSTERTAYAVITGLGTAVRGLTGPQDLLGPLPADHRDAADPVSRLKGRGLRYKDRATKLGMAAAADALRAAGLTGDNGDLTVPGESVGVVASTNYGNADTVCATVQTIAESTYLATSPMTLPATSSNVVASWVAITHGLRGANLTLCNGPTSGLDAVNWARLLIAAGRVERVLVLGVEPDNAAVRHVTGTPQAPVVENPAAVPELFDGAAALVVESAASARARGARHLAAVGPYARRGDHAQAVAAVRSRHAGRIGLWCVPEHPEGVTAPAAGLGTGAGSAPVHDLSALYGPASGALGVLQCAAAAVWLDSRAGGRPDDAEMVLASAGTGDAGWDDASAALLLTHPGTVSAKPGTASPTTEAVPMEPVGVTR
ncbi:beta-ketoacyl synthase N-terminal-like domain-containing protein [Streptomyces sp. TRM68367]|uniref:beta-ketoacyl synthase N-terminal-like domain-containing protein n=1 Tax=Streptomyces sp. TRM68367 TaxID=2758415 RepID=UPI00165B3D16|nr:beta-ketoacyl synthase N-terminal-like domain-containing protein [Streptomyces sp. TRM68367]MBC9724533.1 beta-ketoacyl synthase [Streptomyces sp. TRM68367]